jgi:ribosomal protein S18 acetylase RimI-like enzyme
LVAAVIDAAREAGYSHMRLDCMPSMREAQKLYRGFGFYEIPPYNENPVAGSLFLELALAVGS